MVDRSQSAPVLLIEVPALHQLVEGPLHRAVLQERGLAEPDVETDAERLQVGPDIGKHGLLAVVGERVRAILEGHFQVLVAVELDERLGHLFDVGRRDTRPREREPRCPSACWYRLYTDSARSRTCLPGIVDIELACDVVSDRGSRFAEGVAERGSPAVSHVERPGRVGAHELHEHLLPLADVLQAVLRPFGIDLKERLFPAVLL